jgi:hypothetical protein
VPVINPIQSSPSGGTGGGAGPCEPWPVECPDFPDGASAELIESATMAATEALWIRTKRRFGFCAMTLRPCRRECFPAWPWIPSRGWYNVGGYTWPWPAPALVGGKWINIACGSCGDSCSCSRVSEVQLPYPVANVTQVKIDGVVLDPSAYRVDDWRLLVRLDGEDWPRCNDLNLDDNQVGTWSVTAAYGQEVPHLGQLAAGELASEVARACVNAKGCRLPASTVQSVTRQGVTKVFFDANSAFKGGMIGLKWSDLFIKTFNPTGTDIASIYDIDGPRTRRVGT